ncbi:MAG TPA: AAA family ATPase [Polyangiaceae bacterium]|nr:AAA family ATPase [Polyangiaceae bacterium]
MKVGVMRGLLREFDFGQVLQVAGIGRQYMEIEISDQNAVVGTIVVKSGKVVSAETPNARGRDAFFQLFGRNDGEFEVFRMQTPEVLPEPVGAVSDLLEEAYDYLKQVDPSSPRLSSRPPKGGELPRNLGLAAPPRISSAEPDFSQSPVVAHVEIAPPPALTQDAPPSIDHDALGAPPVPQDAVALSDAVPPPALDEALAAAKSPRTASSPPTPARRSAPPERRSVRPPIERNAGEGAPSRHIRTLTASKVVAVASPKGGCGKTTIALNLGLSLARQGRSVILVDADINGDVLSSINARHRAEIGVYDVLLGVASADEALLDTVLPQFKIMPAVGGQLPRLDAISADHSASWRALSLELAKRADIVLVDTPAGMFGATAQILQSSTHVIGVLQAEAVANRSFSRFVEALRAMPDERRPEVVGIVVNMLQTRVGASLAVFQSAVTDLPGEWLFETTVPRHRAFLDATHAGLPLRHLDEVAPPAVAWLFDNLAGEVAERLRLPSVEKKPQPLLL